MSEFPLHLLPENCLEQYQVTDTCSLGLTSILENGLQTRYLIFNDRIAIGGLRLHYSHVHKTCNIGKIIIEDEFQDRRGQGLGTAIYRSIPNMPLQFDAQTAWLKPHFKPVEFVSSQVSSLNDASRGIWSRLVRNGFAAANDDGTYQYTESL